MLLTKEQILSQRLPSERISVPWLDDSEIIVRALPHHVIERKAKEDEPEQAFIFVNAVVDENGKRMYTDADLKTISETVDRSLIELVVAAAYRLSSIPQERRDAIKKNWTTLAGATSGE